MGLDVLHPSGNPGDAPEINVDIIAIHGLEGNLVDTWTHPNTKSFWLKDFLPTNLSGARIMSFGYNADAAFSSAVSDIDDHATDLLNNVVDKRSERDEQQRPIIFLAHSLGGIIVKQALRQASIDPFYKTVKDFTIGIIFLGTPLQVSDYADYSSVLSNAAALIINKVNPKVTVDALKRNSQYLLGLTKGFRHQIGDYSIVSCYERMPMGHGLKLVSTSHAKLYHEEEDSDEIVINKVVDKQSALLQAAKGEQIPVNANHQEMCKFVTPTDDTYEKLYKRMARMVEAYAKRKLASQIQNHGGRNKHYGVPQRLSPDFMGRDDVCKEIRETCLPDGPQYLQMTQKCFVLYGLGGSGKTQLCLDFAQKHQESFWGIFYIDASTSANAERGFEYIADTCELLGFTSARTKHWLSSCTEPWLLILDNADDPDMDLRSHFPGGNKGTILITTRNPEISMLSTVGSLEIGRLSLMDASTLLLRVSRDAHPDSERFKDLADKITETLGCLALAIVSAAALIRQRICSLEDYCTIFRQHRKRLLANRSSRLPSNQANDVYATWDISREAIENRKTEDSIIALELLNICSSLHFEGFTEEFFKSAWKNDQHMAQDDVPLANVSPLQLVTPALKSLRLFEGFGTQAWNPLPLREALNLINSFSLISYEKDISGKVTGFSLHPLVHSWGRDRLSKSDLDQWSTRSLALLVMSSDNSPRVHLSYKADRQILAHISACSRQSGELSTLSDADLRTRITAERFCWEKLQAHGRIHEACDLAERAIKLASARWGFDDALSLFCMKNLADQYQAMGENARALAIYSDVGERVNKLFPEEELADLNLGIQQRRAICYEAMGYSAHAIRIQKPVVDAWIRVAGRDDPSTIEPMALLVSLYHCASQYGDSTKLGEHVFSARKRLRGTHDPSTLRSARILAEGYMELDERPKSLEIYQWLAEICLSFTSPVNPDVLQVFHRMTYGFHRLGQKEKAKSLKISLVSMSQDTFGPEHPQNRKLVQLLDCHEFLSEVNAGIENPTGPITSALLDRLLAIGSEILGSTELEAVSELQKAVAIVRKQLESNIGRSNKVRQEIVEWLRHLEASFLNIGNFLEDAPKVESTYHMLGMTEETLAAGYANALTLKPEGT